MQRSHTEAMQAEAMQAEVMLVIHTCTTSNPD